jgi:AraC-like DNA-binding protein
MKIEKVKYWVTEQHDYQMISATYSKQQFSKHYHDFYVIGINTSGCHKFYYRGSQWIAPPNHIAVVCPGEIHTGKSASEDLWVYRAIYPTRNQLQSMFESVHSEKTPLLFFSNPIIKDYQLSNIFLRFHRLFEKRQSGLEVDCLLYIFFNLLKQRHSNLNPVEHLADLSLAIKKIKDYIIEFYDNNISLDEISKISGLSKFYLIRKFYKYIGLTPHVFQNNVRIKKALELLRDNKNIAQVACITGFSDQAHLTRWFKRITGITPGLYIKNM